MSGNHTPTPWRIDGYLSVIGPDGKEIHANGFSSIMSYGPAMLDARANAELIVTAVNSYASSQAEIERLRAALEPFAALAGSVFRAYEDGREMNASKADDATVWGFDRVDLTYGDLRRARAALSGSNE